MGTGVQTSIEDLCDLLLKLTDSDLTVTYKPYSAEDIRRLVQNRIGSPVKAAHDLGFVYRDSLEEGLQALIAWRKQHESGPVV